MEPIIKSLSIDLKNPWMMIFTEMDVPLHEFLHSLNNFTSSGLDGYPMPEKWKRLIEKTYQLVGRLCKRWLQKRFSGLSI